MIVTGKCLCHGLVVTGHAGTVAQPRPFLYRDIFGGKPVRCWAVVDQEYGGMPHDLPVAEAVEVRES
jgi:hypothetical protein